MLQLSDHEKANSELLMPHATQVCPPELYVYCSSKHLMLGAHSGACGEELGRGQEAVPVEQRAPVVLDCGPEPGRCLTRIRCLLQM